MKSNLPQWVGSVAAEVAAVSNGNALLAALLGVAMLMTVVEHVLASALRDLVVPALVVWGELGPAKRRRAVGRIVKQLNRSSRSRRGPPPKSKCGGGA